jgi:hypothetical protein
MQSSAAVKFVNLHGSNSLALPAKVLLIGHHSATLRPICRCYTVDMLHKDSACKYTHEGTANSTKVLPKAR